MYYQTLDLDEINKEQLQNIITKIRSQPCNIDVTYKQDSLEHNTNKGYHLLFTCAKKCSICRLVFDDQKRLTIDCGKEEKFQNTIFTEKEYFIGNFRTAKEKCERCYKNGIHTTLSKKELTIKELKSKLKTGNIRGYPYPLVYLSYDYFYCPICNWFKFVKKRGLPKIIIEGEKQ